MNTERIVRTGMFVAVAFVLSYLESLLPLQLGVPGIKLGLSNIVVMISLYSDRKSDTLFIAITRIILCGITFGSLYTMLYSMAGGMLSLLVMSLLKKCGKFSVYGVSVIGGISHNIGQIAVAAIVLRTGLLIYYLPFLMVAGCVAGIAIGFVAAMIIRRTKNIE